MSYATNILFDHTNRFRTLSKSWERLFKCAPPEGIGLLFSLSIFINPLQWCSITKDTMTLAQFLVESAMKRTTQLNLLKGLLKDAKIYYTAKTSWNNWSITGNGFQRSLLVSLLGVLIGIYKKYNQKLFLTTITRAGD